MLYEKFEINTSYPVVDLRSDTISKPTQKMRDAMRDAEVGDDVYNEDPTVKVLEARSASLLGKEAALFVPTGTMANLIAIMVHCSQRGSEMIAGDLSHTFLFEQAGCAQIAGVQLVTVVNKPDGTFSLKELKEKIRINPDVHEPFTTLIVVENTHNMCGGKVVPISWIDELSIIVKEHKIALHMDGARLFNACVQSNVSPERLCKSFDSINFCMSKGLGVPLGALLVGSKTFIEKSRRMRKVLGGGMRQIGIIAAAGLVALDTMIDRLEDDHKRAYKICKAVNDFNGKYFKVDLDPAMTNILMIFLSTDKFTAKEVLARLATVNDTDEVKVCVKAISRNPKFVRITLCHDITDEQVNLAIQKLMLVISELEAIY